MDVNDEILVASSRALCFLRTCSAAFRAADVSMGSIANIQADVVQLLSGRTTVALTLGLIAGMAYPFIDLALACRAPTSEACVWGKAYLPLTLGLSLVMVGGVVAILMYLFLAWKRQRKSNHDTE